MSSVMNLWVSTFKPSNSIERLHVNVVMYRRQLNSMIYVHGRCKIGDHLLGI